MCNERFVVGQGGRQGPGEGGGGLKREREVFIANISTVFPVPTATLLEGIKIESQPRIF